MSAGVEAASTTSAEPGPLFTVELALLLARVGSAVGDDTVEVPPIKPVAGVALDRRRIGTLIVVVAPSAIGPLIVHVIGPFGSEPEQPEGNETISIPLGGV